MTTLMIVGNSEGERRCDAKCYGADPGTRCECVCGGLSHGVGRERAMENTRQHAEELMRAYAEREGLTEYRADVSQAVDQYSLEALLLGMGG